MLIAKFPSFVSWVDYSKEETDKNKKLLHKDLFKKVLALKSKFPELVKVMGRDFTEMTDVFDQ